MPRGSLMCFLLSSVHAKRVCAKPVLAIWTRIAAAIYQQQRPVVQRAAASVAIICCALAVVGCSDSAGVPIHGRLTFNGQPNAGEILIEAVNKDGSPLEGVTPISCFAEQDGEFSVSLGSDPRAELDCRITIRIAEQTASGRPATFDYNARPEKRVNLRRKISGKQRLDLAITR